MSQGGVTRIRIHAPPATSSVSEHVGLMIIKKYSRPLIYELHFSCPLLAFFQLLHVFKPFLMISKRQHYMSQDLHMNRMKGQFC